MLWRKFLARYSQGHDALFDNAFLERWGKEKWNPNAEDEKAAAKLHVQMVSRITTQQLGYLEGVEKTALKSVYDLLSTHAQSARCNAGHGISAFWRGMY